MVAGGQYSTTLVLLAFIRGVAKYIKPLCLMCVGTVISLSFPTGWRPVLPKTVPLPYVFDSRLLPLYPLRVLSYLIEKRSHHCAVICVCWSRFATLAVVFGSTMTVSGMTTHVVVRLAVCFRQRFTLLSGRLCHEPWPTAPRSCSTIGDLNYDCPNRILDPPDPRHQPYSHTIFRSTVHNHRHPCRFRYAHRNIFLPYCQLV
ncbi:hypothetical protein DPMN_113771 [Dreissena polymorpha]|uniref:Uncharacterized protein n=1 Tax=Dreissena polymorpha TaxID=45954 RepID=A0A9D4KIW5_DREPO|nr:hypothetical protein DPMN_113771 [Dreissena polymorpha]